MKRFVLEVDDLRALTRWAAACAARALPIFEAAAPRDSRPRDAIAGARLFARDGTRTAAMRALAWGALRAAKTVDDAAMHAARAAAYAVGAAYLHPFTNAGQAMHILGPAMAAVLAREASGKPGAALVRFAVRTAPPRVRALLRRMPRRKPGRTRRDAVLFALDAGLR